MKTIIKSLRGNNVQKTILRSVAVFVSFVLLSLTVTGHGYWRQLLTNNSFNQIATALVNNSSIGESKGNSSNNYSTTVKGIDYVNPKSEVSWDIEPWITGSRFFDVCFSPVKQINKSALYLENWILESDFFKTVSTNEGHFETESMMTDNFFWKI